ncbi:MAG: MarR family transcriptional regulator [Candidatus Enteromonas sp.]|nr:MarR family transcriptional regulator [Candidatus Enteromonas sp.]
MENNGKSREYTERIVRMFQDGSNASLIAKAQKVFNAPHAMSCALLSRPEGMTASELASIGDCSPSRVTAILDTWEEKGLAERFQQEGDRLHTFVRLTEKGRKGVLLSGNIIFDFICRVFDVLGPEKSEIVIEAIQNIITMGLETVKKYEEGYEPCCD